MQPDDLKRIPLNDVPDLLQNLGYPRYSRQTVYSWARDGIKRHQTEPIFLKTVKVRNRLRTTAYWVKGFMNALG